MLGPVVLVLSMLAGHLRDAPSLPKVNGSGGAGETQRLPLYRMVPPFILVFLSFAALRSAGGVPAAMLAPAAKLANVRHELNLLQEGQ